MSSLRTAGSSASESANFCMCVKAPNATIFFFLSIKHQTLLHTHLTQHPGMSTHIKGLIKDNLLIADLKTDALKDRHWEEILDIINFKQGLTSLTLGDLWNCNLTKNEPAIRDQLNQAQGEMALQEFMKSVKQYWAAAELELVVFKNKCNVIRGWDDIFSQIDEHLNSLTSMKMSPFYKTFEVDATAWESKLRAASTLLDASMDGQRRWVYLEGIFFGAGDIQQLLPQEYSRFKSIDSEFVALMKKASQSRGRVGRRVWISGL